MTDEQKKTLREGVDEIADSMYNSMVSSYEMVEKDLPDSMSEIQKQAVFTQLFTTCFKTQKSLLEATVSDVKHKVKDKDAIAKAMEEVKNECEGGKA